MFIDGGLFIYDLFRLLFSAIDGIVVSYTYGFLDSDCLTFDIMHEFAFLYLVVIMHPIYLRPGSFAMIVLIPTMLIPSLINCYIVIIFDLILN